MSISTVSEFDLFEDSFLLYAAAGLQNTYVKKGLITLVFVSQNCD